MKDLENLNDIEQLVKAFYSRATVDPVIGFFFTEVVQMDWEKHIPLISEFWNGIIFGAATYRGNSMLKHIALSQKQTMKPEHFERWLLLWETNVREMFEGKSAQVAIDRAHQIGGLMKLKVTQHGNSNL